MPVDSSLGADDCAVRKPEDVRVDRDIVESQRSLRSFVRLGLAENALILC